MLVRIVRDWTSPDLLRQTPGGSGRWGDVQFTEDPVRECDYLIALNPPPQRIKVKARRAWLITQEPPVEEYYWHRAAFQYFDRVFTPHPVLDENVELSQGYLPWHIGKSYDELKALSPDADKAHRVSTVTSSAYSRPGHRARYDLIQHLRDTDLDLELFGKGIRFVEDKYDGIAPFRYSIAIENSFYPSYWTEKITDCLLSWTMPVYSGAPDIDEYIDPAAYIAIDPHDYEGSYRRMKAAIEADEWHQRLDAIAEARRKLLDELQFFPAMVERIAAAEANAPDSGKRKYDIPKVPRPNQRSLLERAWRKLKG